MGYIVAHISKHQGYGSTVISKLIKMGIKKNLYYEIKDVVVEEKQDGIHSYKQKIRTKVFGLNSTKEVRKLLIDILIERVENHKDKIISPTIYEELCGLEVKKNGKIEHSSNTHDDQIFSWLWALYIYYNGGDLMNNWGIQKRVLQTDANLEEAVVDIHEDQTETLQAIELDNNEEVEEQLKDLTNAPGKLAYEEWMKQEQAKDDAAMDRILKDKAVRKSLAERYQIYANKQNNGSTIESLPNDIFTDFYKDEYDIEDEQNKNPVLVGNLSQFIQ